MYIDFLSNVICQWIQDNDNEKILHFLTSDEIPEKILNDLYSYSLHINNEEMILSVLKKNNKIDISMSIHKLLENSNTGVIKYILENFNTVNYKENIFKILCKYNNIELIKLLIDNIDISDINDAFLIACHNKYSDLCEFLLNYNVDIDYKNGEPLKIAIENNDKIIVTILLKKNCDYSIDNYWNVSSCIYKNNIDLIKIFLDFGLNPDTNDYFLIKLSKQLNNNEILNLLLSHSSKNIEEILKCNYNCEFLIKTCITNNLENLKKIIDSGYDISIKNNLALLYSLYYKNMDCCKMIVDNISDKNKIRNDLLKYNIIWPDETMKEILLNSL